MFKVDHNDNLSEGGPAFPVELHWFEDAEGRKAKGLQTENRAGWHHGMTLRDYFAAKAMAAMLGNPDAISLLRQVANSQTAASAEVAGLSYMMSDAMLKARQPK